MSAALLLPPERAGPYLRALRAALHAAAPDLDWCPLAAMDTHLHALDPDESAEVLAPASVDGTSGLPDFGWMERAIAAAAIGGHEDVVRLRGLAARAQALDPALAARLEGRARLHRLLTGAALLPALSVGVDPVRGGCRPAARVWLDRRLPGLGWVRLRVDLAARTTGGLHGLRLDGAALRVDPGLQALLSRHVLTPLVPLAETLAEACAADVLRLSRARVGPFWFPGGPIAPAGAPAALILHLSREVLAEDIVMQAIPDDPWLGAESWPTGRAASPGLGLHRERHFAAHRPMVDAVRAWVDRRGSVVPFGA